MIPRTLWAQPMLPLLLLSSNGWAATTAYTTDFGLNEFPISEHGAWKSNGLDWTRVKTAGGLAFGTQTGDGGYDDSYAYLSGFPPDQMAAGVVHLDPATGGTTHEVEILLRWADSEHSARGYECNFAYDGMYADIVRWNGPRNDFTYLVPTLSAGVPGGLHEGDIVSAKIVGSKITTYVNGTQILSVSDDTFKDGNPGIGFFRGAPSGPQNDFSFTSFSASALGASTAVPAPAIGWQLFSLAALASIAGFAIMVRKTSVANRER